ncbi:MAG: extracellular solute-binding protein, partial [Arcanobacterium sp.]|nr:extracellular solute-binding protein [Arcanobacterium sp.]
MKGRIITAVGAAAALALGLGACAGAGSGNSAKNADGKTVVTLWHNSTTGDGKQYWEDMAAAYEKEHADVDIQIQAIQNEDMDGKLQTALQDPQSAPDIFMARGGQKLADVIAAGQAMDLTSKLSDDVKKDEATAVKAFTYDGKIYAVPSSVLPGGIWYSKDLFKQAGIAEPPATVEDLNAAVQKLKAAGITPIALGAKDAWPAAHWWYFFAMRECSDKTFADTLNSKKFTDNCWVKAGEDLQKFAATSPFNEGFLTTSAQQGAGSSAGLVANHKAAMELMGAWDPGVIASLTPDGKPLGDLGYFPFPAVPGGAGAPGAMMGGVDGLAVGAWAPEQAVDFLNFVSQKDPQEKYAKAFQTIPANVKAQTNVTDPALLEV